MNLFTIYPAIDLRVGQVVRLKQGQWKEAKYFDISPAQAAETWMDQALHGCMWSTSMGLLARSRSII